MGNSPNCSSVSLHSKGNTMRLLIVIAAVAALLATSAAAADQRTYTAGRFSLDVDRKAQTGTATQPSRKNGTLSSADFNYKKQPTQDHEIVSPRDPHSGLATGKRMHKPLVTTQEHAISTKGTGAQNGRTADPGTAVSGPTTTQQSRKWFVDADHPKSNSSGAKHVSGAHPEQPQTGN